MINGDMVVAQTLQGATPPTWRIFRAKAAFFYQQIGLALFLLVIGGAGFLDLTNNPNTAYSYIVGGSQPTDVINTWRTIDFIVIALFVFGGLFWLVKNVLDLPRAKEQVLVLMPEGFVINSDKRKTYAFATMRTMSAAVNRGAVSVRVVPANGGKNYNVALDGRFGKPKEIAQMIMTARNQFAAAQVAAQQPVPPYPSAPPQR